MSDERRAAWPSVRRDNFNLMDWEVGKAYVIEGEAPDGEMVYLGEGMTYMGELSLEWTSHTVHVFRTQGGSLIGLRDIDIGSWQPAG